MADKKPRGLRPWLDDIRLDGSGNYAYQGSHLQFSGDANWFHRFKIRLGILVGVLIASAIVAGCLNVGELDNTALVLIPYMLEIIFTAAFAWAAIRLLSSSSIMRSYIHKQTAGRLPVLSLLLAVAGAATAVCAAVFMMLKEAWSVTGVCCLVLHLLVCAAALLAYRVLRSASWKPI